MEQTDERFRFRFLIFLPDHGSGSRGSIRQWQLEFLWKKIWTNVRDGWKRDWKSKNGIHSDTKLDCLIHKILFSFLFYASQNEHSNPGWLERDLRSHTKTLLVISQGSSISFRRVLFSNSQTHKVFIRWMLKGPPANPQDYISRTSKISPREGR